jgi:predicted metal-binding protein
MAQLRTYSHVLVYQTVGQLEDSYDFEGMMQAGQNHNRIAKSLRTVFEKAGISNPLHLGAGGCRVCPLCAKQTGESCRHPELAMSSLEAYGINVSRLAPAADMKYINGSNTVTYFGAVFFKL